MSNVLQSYFLRYSSSNDECRHYSAILCEKNCDIDMMDDIVADGLPLRMESERYSTVVVVRACVREESRSLDSTKTHSFCDLSILYSK